MSWFEFFKKAFVFVVRRVYEFLFVLFLRIKHVSSGGSICPRMNTYSDFIISKKDIYKKKRKDGISGFYRVKNEEQLLERSVLSHLPYLDEIIIVYNDCSDKTPEIAKSLARKYPDKIKVYEYTPKVFPALSYDHVVTCAKSPYSLVNYYNFALAKTNYKVAVKIDADHLAIQDRFAQAVRSIKEKGINTLMYFYGVNVYKSEEGDKWLVNKRNPFTHGFDCGFFPVTSGTYFIHRPKFEALRIPISWRLRMQSLGVLFYHLKAIKPDQGIAHLRVDSFFSKRKNEIKDMLQKPELVTFSELNDKKLDGMSDTFKL